MRKPELWIICTAIAIIVGKFQTVSDFATFGWPLELVKRSSVTTDCARLGGIQIQGFASIAFMS